jgi:hypothetical protein
MRIGDHLFTDPHADGLARCKVLVLLASRARRLRGETGIDDVGLGRVEKKSFSTTTDAPAAAPAPDGCVPGVFEFSAAMIALYCASDR